MKQLRAGLKTGALKLFRLGNQSILARGDMNVIKLSKVLRLKVTLSLVGLCLLLPVASPSAQPEGTGGYDAPYLQADYLQELAEWSANFVNPALLYRINQFHLGGGVYRWGLGYGNALGFGNGSFFIPIRRNQTLGFSLIGAGGGNIEKTRIDDNLTIVKESGATRFYDFWGVASYAARLPLPWLVLGTNLKFRLQRQFDEGLQAAWGGLDVGIYVNPFDHYRFGDLGISLNLQDIVPSYVKWDGGGAQAGVTRLRGGLRYAGLNDKFVADAELVFDNMFISVMKGIFSLGDDTIAVDRADPMADTLITTDPNTGTPDTLFYMTDFTLGYITSRIGAHFRVEIIPQFWLKFGWNNNNIPYIGFNLNLIYPLPEMINYATVEANVGYSFIENINSAVIGDERGFTMTLKGSTDFGPTREQRESKRLYDRLILAPMDAYNEAMRLYMAGKYWDASFAFGKVISLFPNFHLNDKASWYMGDCYHKLYLNNLARETYKAALEEYTTSEMRSKYLFGLERTDYREGKYDDALKNHAFITNLYAESDIRPDADYLAGQIHFERKNYNVAQGLFKAVKPGSASYLYAQYTLSIINIELDREADAIANLDAVVSDTTMDQAERLLQDAANLKLGHIYFEQGDKLRQAVEAYSRVPDGSPYRDEALLGTAWAWIKVNKAKISLETVGRLIFALPQSPLVPEAYLLKGYGLMLEHRFRDAVVALEKCLELVKGDFVDEQDLANRRRKNDLEVQNFIPTAESIFKNAMRKPTNKTVEERPALKAEYDKFDAENKDFFAYKLLAKSHTRFFREKQRVVEDAEYALAKATNMLKSRKTTKDMMDQQKKQSDIDKQIEKLQQQMQEVQ